MVAGQHKGPLERLPPIVGYGPGHRKAPAPLEQDQTYTNVGGDAIFTASPPIVHFGGYEIHKPVRKKILIRNTSSISQRCHIIFPPPNSCFKARCRKKGRLAPGVAEEVVVTFCASEYKYHHDVLRIHSPDVSFTIPLHAYPLMNEEIFPKLIQFPNLHVGQSLSKIYKLTSKVPLSFEFRFEILNFNPDWSVSPLKGIVPANGSMDVTVRFRPSDRVTSSLQMRVHVSQFGFEPFICEMIGSATTILEQSDREFAESVAVDIQRRDQRKPNFGETWAPRARKRHNSLPPLSQTQPVPAAEQAGEPPRGEVLSGNAVVEGHLIPPWIGTSQFEVNKMLNQDPARRAERELRLQIREQQAAANQAAEEEAKHAREAMQDDIGSAAGHPFDFSAKPNTNVAFEGSSSEMKRIVFEHEFDDYAAYEKALDIKPSVERIGQAIPSDEKIAEMRASRERIAAEELLAQQAEDCRRTETVLSSEPVCVPSDIAARVKGEVPAKFDPYRQSTMRMRRQVLERFRGIATKVILRCRADKRLAKMRRYFEAREAGQEASTALGDERDQEPVAAFDPAMIRAPFARQAHDESELDLAPVEVAEIEEPEPPLPQFEMAEALEYKVRGYRPFKNTKLPSAGPLALPDMAATPLQEGALEEYSAMPPSGPRELSRAVRTLPDHLRNAPYVEPFRMLRSDPKTRARIRLQAPDEASPDWALRPERLPPTQLSRRAMTIGGMAGFAVGGPTVSGRFRQRRQSRFASLGRAPRRMRRPVEEDYFSDEDADGEERRELALPSQDPAQIETMFFGADADDRGQNVDGDKAAASVPNARTQALKAVDAEKRDSRDALADRLTERIGKVNEAMDSKNNPLREVRSLMC